MNTCVVECFNVHLSHFCLFTLETAYVQKLFFLRVTGITTNKIQTIPSKKEKENEKWIK